MNIQIYHSLYYVNEDGYSDPFFINDNSKKYIDVKFVQNQINYNYTEELTDEERNQFKFFEAVNCT